ncbi:hypothetical protein [Roseobacter weihaiensis]|uniref:hypothetical protein n=1 Tax=Roseobacter weihaiensis TaxID=2763262 RepID=UPI001D09A113|nr:hypothetical protein [Roseobacter sp. H9]
MSPWPPLRALLVALACLCLGVAAGAEPAQPLALDGQISDDGTKIGLNWAPVKNTSAAVFRRTLDDRGLDTWQPIAPRVLSGTRLLDDDIRPGVAYEYQVRLQGQDGVHIGYWAAGHQVPHRSEARTALIVIDETIATPLALHLDRFELDLIGDGWQVARLLTPRGVGRKQDREAVRQAQALRAQIAERYWSDPFSSYALILVGHVPVAYTGNVFPDGHKPKAVPSDLFYADPEGAWPVIEDAKKKLQFAPGGLPADHIKMQVGRIDFANLGPAFGGEIPLLRAYFDKNHHWRHGRLGDTRQAYGQNKHVIVERNGLRNIVGPDAVTAGGHHDTTGQGPFLFGVDFGSWKGGEYATLPPSEAVFTINFGSGKHMFAGRDNPMTALLAQPWYPLTSAWGGRPAWQLHTMALGESIGAAHLRTVNNGERSRGMPDTREYVPTGRYDWINPTWVNLLGDPTLRPFPLSSLRDFSARAEGHAVQLSWTLPAAAQGVILYRAETRAGPYRALAGGDLLTGGAFTDPGPVAGAWYMARAQGLAEVYAGSFYRLSQGAFATAENSPPEILPEQITLTENTPVPLDWPVTDPDNADQLLAAPLRGPARALRHADEGVVFDPAGVQRGRLTLSFSVFDGVASRLGTVEIDTSGVAP